MLNGASWLTSTGRHFSWRTKWKGHDLAISTGVDDSGLPAVVARLRESGAETMVLWLDLADLATLSAAGGWLPENL